MQTERGVDDVGGDLAKVEGPSGKVPERSLAPHRLVDGTQRFGRDRRVGRVELEQEDPVAAVDHFGDALDRRLGERPGDLHVSRGGTVRRAGRQRRLEALAQRRRRCRLVAAGGSASPGTGSRWAAAVVRGRSGRAGGSAAQTSSKDRPGAVSGPPGDDEGRDHSEDQRRRR